KYPKRWEREIKAGQSVLHPNVLQFLGFCNNPDPECSEFKGLVLPFCVHGDARKYTDRHPNADRMSIVRPMVLSVHHNTRILHSQQNVLIGSNCQPLLSDFGLSRICETKGFTTRTFNNSIRWTAAELVRSSVHDDTLVRATTASDVWSFGMLILEVSKVSLRNPYKNE
ncbi:kinase-like protein, partial [Fomitiporia mediterranea MF3/22]|uniref:kinase-like protein n=1 Tax=Fomitiporia mediterranea (strain MF3/22) TaxID=694068 RepID=UPI0004409AB0